MQLAQALVSTPDDLPQAVAPLLALDPDLVLVFGSPEIVCQEGFHDRLSAALPRESLIGCSTAGEIACDDVHEQSCILTAVRFEQTPIHIQTLPFAADGDATAAGHHLGQALLAARPENLRSVLLFARGTNINGSALIDGLQATIGDHVVIAGGLAGDDGAFRHTVTISPAGISDQTIVAAGLYGDAVVLRNGSAGGWHPFGPTRRVTRSQGNILYTLDDEPALDLYKRYLGDYASGLPASGLLFPFEMLNETAESVGLIRTLLGVNEADKSLTFAGDIREGGFVRMMHSSTDQLILGAEQAADLCLGSDQSAAPASPALALLVSCVGRKLVMGDRLVEEVDSVQERLASELHIPVTISGFYSYGEINPHGKLQTCQLHNQTMTIAVIQEYAKP
ncbi:FIST signal transduction protein [Insolitispirillum peregrinum]|uniref:FIST signal transduction protein n=1 Tax=Insolitispirillum peregrinum TaxID=80876 RepID=UPI00360C7F6D